MGATLNGPNLTSPRTLGDITIIGGDQNNKSSDYMYVQDRSVSIEHAKIEKLSGPIQLFCVFDSGKSNDGTFVNSKQLKGNNEPYLLSSGDRIAIGNTPCIFEKDHYLRGTLESRVLPRKRILGTSTTIGGDQNNKSSDYIFLPTAFNNHAKIDVVPLGQEEVYVISNLSTSIRGTSVNGKPLNKEEPHFLNSGDKIEIGTTPYTFEQTSPFKPGSTSKPSGQSSSLADIGCGFILGILATLFAVWIISLGVLNQNQPTAQNTLTTFCDAVKKGNYQSAYNQLSNSAQSQVTERQFASKLQQTFTRQGGLKDCTVGSNVLDNGSTTTGTLTYIFNNGRTASHTDMLVKENNVWKISNLKL